MGCTQWSTSPHEWRAVTDPATGGTYWWKPATGQVTPVGAARPRDDEGASTESERLRREEATGRVAVVITDVTQIYHSHSGLALHLGVLDKGWKTKPMDDDVPAFPQGLA